MSDFNYEIERTDHYSLVNAILYGQSVQDGTPTPSEPVDVQVVQDVNVVDVSQTTAQSSNVVVTVNNDSVRVYTTANSPYRGAIISLSLEAGKSYCGKVHIDYVSGIARVGFRRVSDNVFVGVATGNQTQSGDYKFNLVNYDGTPVYLSLLVTWSTSEAGDATFSNLMLNEGAKVMPYTPYGSIGIVIGDTATPIDLQGNVLASLPDGTKDVLTVDGTGHCVLTKAVSHIASYNGESVGDVYMSTTGQLTTGAEVYYKASSTSTVDLGYIDLSYLQDIPAEIPISFVTSLTPDSSYLYKNNPVYEIKNPYEDYNAPEYAYPPNHFGQEWETFDANDWNKTDMLDYTGQMESHAVYTVELCELMQSGTFNWKRPELDWSEAAYNEEQYERFCKYFESRFMFREISMLPPLHWFTALKRMMVYELMPKYKPLYAQIESGLAPLGENEYYKERHVSSAYPETLLSGNSDYISSGEDKEWERVKVNNAAEALEAYRDGFRSVDAALGDELEILFVSMYTSYVNGL